MSARPALLQVVVISGFPKGHPLAADTAHRRLCAALERPVSRVAQNSLGQLARGSVELDALSAAMGARS